MVFTTMKLLISQQNNFKWFLTKRLLLRTQNAVEPHMSDYKDTDCSYHKRSLGKQNLLLVEVMFTS